MYGRAEYTMTKKKVLLVNASPKPGGNTALALDEMRGVLEAQGLEPVMVHIGNKDVRGCIACNYCKTHGRCVFNDIVNETAPLFEEAAGLVIGSPVYYANPNGTASSFLQRLFYSTPFDKTMKVGASVAVARRGGGVSTFDALNKYFTIAGMPVASSCYWNLVYGRLPGEAAQDAEGLRTMRVLAKNMAFLIQSIDLGIQTMGLPEPEEPASTSFIR